MLDQDVHDLLIAALPVAGGVVVGVLVAKLTADRTRQLEREKWKRELYASFIHSAGAVRDGIRLIVTGTPEDDWAAQVEPGQRSLIEIKMIAPSMRPTAEATWTAVTNLIDGVLKFNAATPTTAGPAVPIDRSRYAELDDAARLAINAFIDRASLELGD